MASRYPTCTIWTGVGGGSVGNISENNSPVPGAGMLALQRDETLRMEMSTMSLLDE